MQIWVDADACPGVIKDILFRAAERHKLPAFFVANRSMHLPRSPLFKMVTVADGFDVADRHIVQAVQPGDLVITADIPLAAAVIDKHAHALNPRGEFYNKDNIRQRLSMRNFMDELRSTGVNTGGPAPLSGRDRKAFADELDRFLTRVAMSKPKTPT
jgi:uncharacterized protein YaiI (UPF0178 family)